MNTQLLCTFTDILNYEREIKSICHFYTVVFGKIYCLQNLDNLDQIYLTYNVNSNNIREDGFYKNTISVHRKKDSNSIYTINSMNTLIKHLNNGVLDKSYEINWNDYSNSIMLTGGNSDVKLIPTKLFKILNI